MTLSRALMRTLAAVACVGAFLTSASAGDLRDVPRALGKEPAYQGKPAYALLVFGADLKQRVWVVLDGATAYVDRNGNGDLTDPDEKVVLPGGPDVDETDEVKTTMMQFDLGDLPAAAGPARYTGLTLTRFVVEPKPGSSVSAADDVALSMLVAGTHSQGAKPRLRPKAAEAPVIHIDGALTALAAPGCDGKRPVLTKGAEGEELTIQIGTLGIGEGSWSSIGYEQVPEDCKPVLEVAFPPAKAGGAPVVMKFTLDDRC